MVLGTDGLISFAALKWLYDIGAGFVMLDWNNRVICASAPARQNALLHRAQALAAYMPVGCDIIRTLLKMKLDRQADNLAMLGKSDEIRQIQALASKLSETGDLSQLRVIESQAAKLYWDGWRDVPLRFARRDSQNIPEGWCRFGSRMSSITKKTRNASNPANALLNYLYALLEAETRLACLQLGLHPGLGILHTDRDERDSCVYDLMEAARPTVDRWLLQFLNEHRFSRKDFFETTEGGIRVTLPLRHVLVESMALWREAIAPVAEYVGEKLLKWYGKHVLGRRDVTQVELPTRLTQRKRSPQRLSARMSEPDELPRVSITACLECGEITDGETFCSEACRRSHQEQRQMTFVERGKEALLAMRASELDPARTPEARQAQSEIMSRRRSEQRGWEQEHGPGALERERERFRQEIQPRLRSIPLRKMSRITGLSLYYCSQIRKGKCIPHPVHHAAFRRLLSQVTQ